MGDRYLIPASEACKYFGVGEDTFRRYVGKGFIKIEKCVTGKHAKYRRSDVIKAAKALEEDTTGPEQTELAELPNDEADPATDTEPGQKPKRRKNGTGTVYQDRGKWKAVNTNSERGEKRTIAICGTREEAEAALDAWNAERCRNTAERIAQLTAENERLQDRITELNRMIEEYRQTCRDYERYKQKIFDIRRQIQDMMMTRTQT